MVIEMVCQRTLYFLDLGLIVYLATHMALGAIVTFAVVDRLALGTGKSTFLIFDVAEAHGTVHFFAL